MNGNWLSFIESTHAQVKICVGLGTVLFSKDDSVG